MSFFVTIQQNIHFFVFGAILFSLILFILCVVSLCKISNLKKRINQFMTTESGSDFESMLKGFIEESKEISENQKFVLDEIKSVRNQMSFCIQKVGIVRYNPFNDVGGDLCYAVAILDQNNDGVVLNSVYSRDGCYTYAKPIENGVSQKYKLSGEEEQAVSAAMKKNSKV